MDKIFPAVPIGAAGAKNLEFWNLEFWPKKSIFHYKKWHVFKISGGAAAPRSPPFATPLGVDQTQKLPSWFSQSIRFDHSIFNSISQSNLFVIVFCPSIQYSIFSLTLVVVAAFFLKFGYVFHCLAHQRHIFNWTGRYALSPPFPFVSL